VTKQTTEIVGIKCKLKIRLHLWVIKEDRQRDTQKNRHTHIHQISLPHETDKAFDSNEEE